MNAALTDATGTDAMLLDFQVQRFLAGYQRAIDEHRYLDVLELFVAEGTYSVIDVVNARDQGLYLICDEGLEARKERCAYLMGYWKVPRSTTSHFLTNVLVAEAGDTVTVQAKFLVYRTDREGTSRFHACGEYVDELVRIDGEIKFRSHRVVIDLSLLPDDFTELL